MPIKFYIFDKTEAWKRAERLESAIKSKAHTCQALRTVLDESISADVIMYHRTNFAATTPGLLARLAKAGKVVVAYTAGSIAPVTVNGVHQRSLAEVERLLNWLTDAWTVDDVRNALDLDWADNQSRGFTALAILAQCASAIGVTGTARKRQLVWQTNEHRWREVINMTGLALLQQRAERDGKQIAASLLQWIDTGERPPDFVAAAKEAAELAG